MADYTYGQSLAPQKTSNLGPRLAFAGHALQLAGGLGSMFSESARRKKEVEDENKAIARANLISVLSGQAQQPMMRYRGPNLTEQVSKGASVVGKVLSSYGQYVDESKTREQQQRLQGLNLRNAERNEAARLGKEYYNSQVSRTIDRDSDLLRSTMRDLGYASPETRESRFQKEYYSKINREDLYDENGVYIGSEGTGDRNVRNHNPGNIQTTLENAMAWYHSKGISVVGLDDEDGDGFGYVIFATDKDGKAALVQDINAKYNDEEIATIGDFARKYIGGQLPGDPTAVNKDQQGTIDGLSNYLSILNLKTEDTPLHLINRDDLIAAIVINESGTDSAVHFGYAAEDKPRVNSTIDNIAAKRTELFRNHTKNQLALNGFNPYNRREELVNTFLARPENAGKTMSDEFRNNFITGIEDAIEKEKVRSTTRYLDTARLSFTEEGRALARLQNENAEEFRQAQLAATKMSNNNKQKFDSSLAMREERKQYKTRISASINSSSQMKSLEAFDDTFDKFMSAVDTLDQHKDAYRTKKGLSKDAPVTFADLKEYGGGALDIVAINMFQRLIDPATVREGDFAVWMTRGGGAVDGLQIYIQNLFGDGASISGTTLEGMRELAIAMRKGVRTRVLARTLRDISGIIKETRHLDVDSEAEPRKLYEWLQLGMKDTIDAFQTATGMSFDDLKQSRLNLMYDEEGNPLLKEGPLMLEDTGKPIFVEHEDDVAFVDHIMRVMEDTEYLPDKGYATEINHTEKWSLTDKQQQDQLAAINEKLGMTDDAAPNYDSAADGEKKFIGDIFDAARRGWDNVAALGTAAGVPNLLAQKVGIPYRKFGAQPLTDPNYQRRLEVASKQALEDYNTERQKSAINLSGIAKKAKGALAEAKWFETEEDDKLMSWLKSSSIHSRLNRIGAQ